MDETHLYNTLFASAKRNLPYVSGQEQQAEWMTFLDLLATLFSEYNHNNDTPYVGRSRLVSEERFWDALQPEPILPCPDAQVAYGHLKQRSQLSVALPLQSVIDKFALSPFQEFCLILASSIHYNRKYETIFGFLLNSGGPAMATLGLAVDLFSLVQPVADRTWHTMLDSNLPINQYLLQSSENPNHLSVLAKPLAMNQLVYTTINHGLSLPDHRLKRYYNRIEPNSEPLLLHHQQVEQLESLTKETLTNPAGQTLVYVAGEPGMGKTFALSQVSERLGVAFCQIQTNHFKDLPTNDVRAICRDIATKCLLENTIPCLGQIDMEESYTIDTLQEILPCFSQNFPLLLLCGTQPNGLHKITSAPFFTVQILPPTELERNALWQHFLGQDDYTMRILASRYSISCQKIRMLTHLVNLKDPTPILTQVNDFMRLETEKGFGKLAKRIPANFTWEDLLLPSASLDLLKLAENRLAWRNQIFHHWNFEKKLPYGRGTSILLYGPPGTGKTMSAQVLAKGLQMDIYRVDLSQIVDKYIGETQKNLGELFDAAEKSSCILFFDEADALFSKRTEVSDSKDKYANMETAYLLQRMEQYGGMTILATNNRNNFDAAFHRRITYSVHVPVPDVETRKKIWKQVFPKEIPLASGLSFVNLAEKYEFSGSSIKSIALQAAYLAAPQGSTIQHHHLAKAVELECNKSGFIFNEGDVF